MTKSLVTNRASEHGRKPGGGLPLMQTTHAVDADIGLARATARAPDLNIHINQYPKSFQVFMRALLELLDCETCYAAVCPRVVYPAGESTSARFGDARRKLVELCSELDSDTLVCVPADDPDVAVLPHVAGSTGYVVVGRVSLRGVSDIMFAAWPRRCTITKKEEALLLRGIVFLATSAFVPSGDASDMDAALLNIIRDPALLVDRDLYVIGMNERARQLVAADSNISIERGRLSVCQSAADKALRGEVVKALSGDPHARPPEYAVRLSSDPDSHAYACISPIASAIGRTLAIITLPSFDENEAASHLSGVYKLSRTEERTLAGILRGLTPPQMSKAQQVSEATARTYIKRIMSKMQVRRQSELFRLALASMSPIRMDVRPRPPGADRSEAVADTLIQ
jgi:DNA-binding CsgD family transcriptional regulator